MISLVAAAMLASSAAGAPDAAAADRNDPNRVICHQRPVTGTRLRYVRTCLTQQEWNERREQIARGMRDYTTREMTSQPPPPITPGSD